MRNQERRKLLGTCHAHRLTWHLLSSSVRARCLKQPRRFVRGLYWWWCPTLGRLWLTLRKPRILQTLPVGDKEKNILQQTIPLLHNWLTGYIKQQSNKSRYQRKKIRHYFFKYVAPPNTFQSSSKSAIPLFFFFEGLGVEGGGGGSITSFPCFLPR